MEGRGSGKEPWLKADQGIFSNSSGAQGPV